MRAWKVLFSVFLFVAMASDSFTQTIKEIEKIECGQPSIVIKGFRSHSVGQPLSLDKLVSESHEIVYGKFVSFGSKCFVEKTPDGYELVAKPTITLDTSRPCIFFW